MLYAIHSSIRFWTSYNMTNANFLRQLIIGLFLLGCHSKPNVKVEEVKLNAADSNSHKPIASAPAGLKVSAYLIYEDGSISTFDVLNDKTKALWNTIIGAGDAEKPSTSTKIILTGQFDSLRIKILNGKKKVLDQGLPNVSGDHEFIIKNTGCEIVKVYLTKNKKSVFENNIDFHCGD